MEKNKHELHSACSAFKTILDEVTGVIAEMIPMNILTSETHLYEKEIYLRRVQFTEGQQSKSRGESGSNYS